MSFKSINPVNEQCISEYDEMSKGEMESILKNTQNAFLKWKSISFEDRGAHIKKIARELRSQKKELAEQITQEMGKPIVQSEAEIEKCALVCEHYADNAHKMLANELIQTEASKSYVHFDPLGVVLAVMPWNFPFWQVFRCLAPILMGGNAMLLKHASNVSGCALSIEKVCKDAGLPEDVFRTLLISVPAIAPLIKEPEIAAVTLTGSTPAGKSVAKNAGEVLKKVVLELGGSDPYIVLEDADLELAAKTCSESRLINGGQSCVAAKRFIVVKEVKAEFEDLMAKHMGLFKMGDPMSQETTIGPLARVDLRDSLHDQVTRSVGQGARIIMGGEVPQGKGAYYPPTILTDVKKGMVAYEEEMFGPVASIIQADDERQAIDIANDSIFGLGAAVFTNNINKGEEIAAKMLNSGSCFVNSFVRSDVRLPFGGIKESGYGRELGSYGIKEFTNIKTVYVS